MLSGLYRSGCGALHSRALVAVGKTAWHHHPERSQPSSCQLSECDLRRQSVCPLGAFLALWPCVGVWGTEISFITSMWGWDQRPEWPNTAKSILSWGTALAEQPGGCGPAGCSIADRIWLSMSLTSTGKHMEIYGKVSAACLCMPMHTHHTPESLNLLWPGKLLFGNDNNNNGVFSVCPHVGLSENRIWVWEVEKSKDKAGGSTRCLWYTVVPLNTLSAARGLAAAPRPSSQPSGPTTTASALL